MFLIKKNEAPASSITAGPDVGLIGQSESLAVVQASAGRASVQACSRKEKNRRVHKNPPLLCLTGLFPYQIGST
jgi:hypothetical protein